MKIIVGLGNPGRRYDATPHNLGFQVADELARRWSLGYREDRRARAEVAEGLLAGRAALLIKPQTFMNLSGEAVAPFTRQRELAADDLLVITDDVALPIGRLRIRPRAVTAATTDCVRSWSAWATKSSPACASGSSRPGPSRIWRNTSSASCPRSSAASFRI